MEDSISLFPHNEIGYQQLVQGLNDYPLAFIEHATGTGKSFILLKYLYLHKRHKRILFVSMHDEMFDQLFFDQMPTLGMNKSDFKCFDTMIYPNIIRHNMQDIIDNYDVIVFDEAHHCGAQKWSQYIRELKELVLKTPGKVMIGATATSIRYLDDYMDVSEQFFDGHTVSRLPVSTAILNNLLPAPIVINSLLACNNKLEKVIKKINRLPKNKETIKLADRLSSIDNRVKVESDISNTLKRYDVKPGEKYIVFCSSIEDVRQKQKEAEEWFSDIGTVKMFTAHSGQKKEKNKEQIAEFSLVRPEISLMFAVDIFNEGFHIEGVDGILMFRKTKSPIVYFQQIGRALSFSVRKKQIKIFDFVDNISNNDVIYELYREMILEARQKIKEDPSKKEFYEEILKRFQIIDEATQIIDELNDIEKFIDDNYISRSSIDNAIDKLEEYRTFYPDTDFTEELDKNHIGYDYVMAYNYICRMNEDLTIDQTDRLSHLNIKFSYEINLPHNERLELLNGYPTIRKLKEALFTRFVDNYIAFFDNHLRRPEPSSEINENDLYYEHRKYLYELTPHKLSRLMARYNFPATLEEIILSGNYPSKEMVDAYIESIKCKVINQQPLDKIELKVMRKLVHTISLKEVSLIEMINNYDEIPNRIDEAINVIREYKKMYNPNEKFKNIKVFIGEHTIYNALKIIYKYASRITTEQFEKLLELDIALPPTIDMTLEERLRILGEYNSFYEKEEGEGVFIINEYVKFIRTHARRPGVNDDELALANRYFEELMHASTPCIRNICAILKYYNIPLSFYEKLVMKEPVSIDTIYTYINEITNKIHNHIKINSKELKILRAINRNKYDLNININELIEEITKINSIYESIEKIRVSLNKGVSPDSFEIRLLLRSITNNYKYLTISHLKELESLNISFAKEVASHIGNLDGYINIYERDIALRMSFTSELEEYLKTQGRRPVLGSTLDIKYRNYLSVATRPKVISIVNLLIKAAIPLTFLERVLINGEYNELEVREFVTYTENKMRNHEQLDRLESRVLSSLYNKGYVKNNLYKNKMERRQLTPEEEIEKQIVSRLRETIAKNPDAPINYDNTLFHITATKRHELEEYRLTLLSDDFFRKVLDKLKNSKCPLTDCLTVSEYSEFTKYSSLKNLDGDALALLNTILALDSDYRFSKKGIERHAFIEEYITFIKGHYGTRPSLSAIDEEELKLALNFHEIQTFLTPNEFQKIEKAIKDSNLSASPDAFYDHFISFILNNGRFPCGNSDNSDEVMLNNLYVNYSGSLTKEQLMNLRKLRKKYSQATVKANLAFSKKHELKKQK